MSQKPVCFVAMAFSHPDTDRVYAQLILPVLKQNDVTPVIINRRQSNDDLNVQIMQKLAQADFSIADLTYARPSVYFEAGFAQSSIPVIYTVRKDHLAPGQPQDLRVHFDLQMKPIIAWRSPKDRAFQAALASRLRATILSDWRRGQRQDALRDTAIKAFNAMPLQERLVLVRRQAIYSMRPAGFGLSQWQPVRSFYQGSRWDFDVKMIRGAHRVVSVPAKRVRVHRTALINGRTNYVDISQRKGKKLIYVSVQAYASVTKNELRRLYQAYSRGFNARVALGKEERLQIHTIWSNVVVLSLKPLSATKIEGTFADYDATERSKTYTCLASDELGSHPLKIISTIHFLSGIQSDRQSRDKLHDLVANHILKQVKTSRD